MTYTPAGYTDLPSRLPTQASTLYSNNITKFLLSMVSEDKKFVVDLEDEVVRRSIVTHKKQMLWPAPVPPPPPAPAVTEAAAPTKVAEVVAITPYKKAATDVALLTGGLGGIVGIGAATGAAFMSNVFTLGLAGLIGYRAVWGVAPALHSPLVRAYLLLHLLSLSDTLGFRCLSPTPSQVLSQSVECSSWVVASCHTLFHNGWQPFPCSSLMSTSLVVSSSPRGCWTCSSALPMPQSISISMPSQV